MGFKCGIVGLPNVGKSTLFNALTQAGIAAANFPFCTIEPNSGTVPVPDPRLHQLAEIVNPMRVIPTNMTFVDIAGLVKGAAAGEGLGNQFLANIRETDAIGHVVRCFEDNEILHVSGAVDPINDIEIINLELALSDLEVNTRALHRAQKKGKCGDKKVQWEINLLESIQQHLAAGRMLRSLPLAVDERAVLEPLNFLTLKPVLYIANINDTQGDNPYLRQVVQLAAEENASVVPICAALEAEIALLAPTEKMAFLKEFAIHEPGLNRLIRAGYQLLGLHTYFTAGIKEVRAWAVPVGANAPKAAGKIHSDFEKGFIRAEVISYDDYTRYRGETGAKEAGKWRSEGKEYLVKDGDIIHFRFNV